MPEDHKAPNNTKIISLEEIDQCISILEQLTLDTNQLFELSEEKRTALLKVSGLLSRPNRDEFQRRRKDAKKAAKRNGHVILSEQYL